MNVWTVVGEFIAGLAVVAIVAAVRPARRWLVSLWKTVKGFGSARRGRKLARRRKLILECARQLGVVVPVSQTGHSPVIVKMSDGTTRSHFRDHQSYRSAMQSLATPIGTSYNSPPPRVVASWSLEECDQWLAANPSQIKTN
jgi:hypothetical protein